MKRKILSAFAVLCVLIFASCADFDTAEQQDKHTDGSSACITISLSEASRTAFPTIDKQGENLSTSGTKCYPFDSITLKGTPVTENTVAAVPVEKTWETEKVGLKYTYAVTKMEGASINVTAGATYMFTLTARHGNNSWQGTVGKTIMSGTNSLSFTLELNSLSSESTESYGELFVQLTVPETVKAADADLKNLDESQIIMQGENVYSSASAQYPTMATFSNRFVPAGSYVVVFTLWGDEGKTLKLGEWREYAQVSSGETSESHPVIKDLSSIHTVTFRSMITQNRNYYGGGYNSAYIKEVSVLYGDTVERPQDPEPDSRPLSNDNSRDIYFNRDDDFFSGWYVSEDGGNTICDTAFDFSTPITSDTVLVANFETVEYSYATSANGEFTQFKFNDEGECALTAGEKIYLKARSSSESSVVKYKLDNGGYKDIDPTEAIPLSLGSQDICIKLAEAETEYHLKVESVFNRVTGLEASADRDTDGYNVVNLKWNSYDGDSRVKAAGDKGGYFLDARKKSWNPGYSTLMSVDDLQNIPSSLEDIENIESKDYFSLKITSDDLKNGTYSIKGLPSGTDYCFYLVAYGGIKEGTTALLNAQAIGSVLVRTAGNPTAELNIYGHYVYDYHDHDGGTPGQYYWSFSEASDEDPLGLSGFNLYETVDYGSPSVGDVIDYLYGECDKKFGSGRLKIEMASMQDLSQSRIAYFGFLDEKKQTAKEKQHFTLSGNKYCTTAKFSKNDNNKDYTKCVTKTINRTKNQSFTYEWNAWEYDSSSSDDYLGKVTATFTYNTLTDTWTCVWSSTCGASGKSTIRAGERTGKDNGSKDDGLRWELHNTDEGELEFHWDWGWDEEQ